MVSGKCQPVWPLQNIQNVLLPSGLWNGLFYLGDRQYWLFLLVFWETSPVYFTCNLLSSPNFSVSNQITKKNTLTHPFDKLNQNYKKQKTLLVFLEIIFKDSDASWKDDTVLFTRDCSPGSRDVFRQPVKQTEERTVPPDKKWTDETHSCWILQKAKNMNVSERD